MKLGWQLFDHGLNTPAEGAQKWQRALFKPFSSAKVKPWRVKPFEQNYIIARRTRDRRLWHLYTY